MEHEAKKERYLDFKRELDGLRSKNKELRVCNHAPFICVCIYVCMHIRRCRGRDRYRYLGMQNIHTSAYV